MSSIVKYYRLLAIAVFGLFFSLHSQAQSQNGLPYAIQKGSLTTQFTNITNMSRSFEGDFKLIRKSNLEIIKNNVLDSISGYQKQIADLKANSSTAVNSVAGLRDSVKTLDTELQAERSKTDSIGFLGMDFAKGSYHTMVWSIIAVLALAFVISFFSFRKAKVDTIDHKKTAEELSDELQTLRKKSIEKEQILKRQLLDEQLKKNP